MSGDGPKESRTHELLTFDDRSTSRFIDVAESSLCNFVHNGVCGEQLTREQWIYIMEAVREMNVALKMSIDEMIRDLQSIEQKYNTKFNALHPEELRLKIELGHKPVNRGRRGYQVSICLVVKAARRDFGFPASPELSMAEKRMQTAPMNRYPTVGSIQLGQQASSRSRGLSTGSPAQGADMTGLARQSSQYPVPPPGADFTPQRSPRMGHHRAQSESAKTAAHVSPSDLANRQKSEVTAAPSWVHAQPSGLLPPRANIGVMPHDYENTVQRPVFEGDSGRPMQMQRQRPSNSPVMENGVGYFHEMSSAMTQNARRDYCKALMEDKPSGAWLLRYTPEKKQFILTVKYHGNILHFKIDKDTNGRYYIMPGTTFGSIIDLLEYYKQHPISNDARLLQSVDGQYAVPIEPHLFS